ncbi:MAG TPA: hypothetical protein VHC71_07060 [Hyphomicrobium sp.]|jgi:hypothetical protein|nr:hypothetical protein [Hyphomicrobium sp.]
MSTATNEGSLRAGLPDGEPWLTTLKSFIVHVRVVIEETTPAQRLQNESVICCSTTSIIKLSANRNGGVANRS